MSPKPAILLSLFAVLLASFPMTATAASMHQLWDEGTLEYRAGRYTSACKKLQQAGRREPEDGALWADLGLCLAKLGQRKAALEANHNALRFGDSRTRSNATFNLAKLGVNIPMPRPGKCDVLPPAPNCGKKLYACTFDWRVEGSGMGHYGSAVRFGRTAEAAKNVRPPHDGGCGPVIPERITGQCQDDYSGADVLLEQREEVFCGKYDWMSDWNCENSSAVRKRAAICLCGSRSDCLQRPNVVAALPYSNCFKRVCKSAMNVPWPAVQREKDKAKRDLRRSNASCMRNNHLVTGSCRIVAADACANGVGIICHGESTEPGPAFVLEWVDLATYEPQSASVLEWVYLATYEP